MKKVLTPHITEKAYRTISDAADQSSTYTFKVPRDLTKDDVKRMVEREYKVSVLSVRVVRLPSKVRRFKGVVGKTSAIKKAIVQLKKGDRIADFDNVKTEGEKE